MKVKWFLKRLLEFDQKAWLRLLIDVSVLYGLILSLGFYTKSLAPTFHGVGFTLLSWAYVLALALVLVALCGYIAARILRNS